MTTKPFDQLTEKELSELNSTDIHRYQLNAVEAKGIVLPHVKDYEALRAEVTQPDEVLWKVDGVAGFFKTKSDADSLADTLATFTRCECVDGQCEDGHYPEKPYVDGKECYSPALYQEVMKQVAANEIMETKAAEESREYNTSIADASAIMQEISGKVEKAQKEYRRLNMFTATFRDEYMTKSDEKTAMDFMSMNYVLTTEDVEYILANYKT